MFVHTVIMVIEPHMKQGRQHKLISTIFLATSVTKKLDHNSTKSSIFLSRFFPYSSLITLSIPTALLPSNSLWHCFSISSFIKWYTDVNIGCFDFADISAILTNFVSIISSVPEYGSCALSKTFTMQSPSLHRHCPISTVLWDCPTTYHSFEILRFQLQLHTLLRGMAGSPQLMCIHNVKHDWFSDSAVPHNTRHIALHDIVFRTS